MKTRTGGRAVDRSIVGENRRGIYHEEKYKLPDPETLSL